VALPWQTLDAADTPDGRLELRRRGPDDFLITIGGRVLMNSRASLSERALGRLAGEAVAERAAPRVLVGGLGMGCTLRACLDALPAPARVVVAELHEPVARWCRDGPLAELTGGAARDPRVAIRIADVADEIRAAARPGGERFDAVVLDLFEGPRPACPPGHPVYGPAALGRAHAALHAGGVLAVWLEEPAPGFERSLGRAGFAVRRERAGAGGRRHAIVLATRRKNLQEGAPRRP
jgi:spermidine synthase